MAEDGGGRVAIRKPYVTSGKQQVEHTARVEQSSGAGGEGVATKPYVTYPATAVEHTPLVERTARAEGGGGGSFCWHTTLLPA